MHQNFDEERQLDEHTLRKISIIRDTLNKIIEEMGKPIDPKAIAMLEMVVDMLEEQVNMDKIYEYPDCPSCDGEPYEKPNFNMLFFKNENGPSVDELKNMFDTTWMDNDDS